MFLAIEEKGETNAGDGGYWYWRLIYLLGLLIPLHILMPAARLLVGICYVYCHLFC